MSTVDTSAARPTVDDVALLLRARTKDSAGNEVGTFDDDTRPTGDQVDEQITAAMALVGTRLPPLASFDADLYPAVASVVAYRAALRVEKSYFPEQVRSSRSAYDQLHAEYLEDLEALVTACQDSASMGGGDVLIGSDVGMLVVGSWTSMPGSFVGYDAVDYDLDPYWVEPALPVPAMPVLPPVELP